MSENSTNELLIRMEEKYKKMSKGQKRLADYVTENYDKAVFLTAARLGEVVGVSESTVVRFVKQNIEESIKLNEDFMEQYKGICIAMSKYQKDYSHSANN